MCKPPADQSISDRISRLSPHDVTLRGLVREGDGRKQVGADVNDENGDHTQRQGGGKYDKTKERHNFWDVRGQHVGYGFLHIVKYHPPYRAHTMKYQSPHRM